MGIETDDDSEKVRTISECEICSDLADRAFESGPTELNEIALKFLAHVIQNHTEEVLAVLADPGDQAVGDGHGGGVRTVRGVDPAVEQQRGGHGW